MRLTAPPRLFVMDIDESMGCSTKYLRLSIQILVLGKTSTRDRPEFRASSACFASVSTLQVYQLTFSKRGRTGSNVLE